MRNLSREAVMTALFSLLTASASFNTASRRLRLWTNVNPAERPALFLVDHGEDYYRQSESAPEVININADIYIYIDAGKDQSTTPITALNNLIDAIDNALAPDRLTGLQTLGGLVSHCWIEGKVLKDPGDLDGDGIAVIPIKIQVPC